MKTVKILAQLLTLQCPTCDDTIKNPDTGSYDWYPSDLTDVKSVTCDCGTTLKVGTKVSLV